MLGVLGMIAGLGSIILSGGDATAAVILIPLGIYDIVSNMKERSR